jgi:hypothetical protein
MKIAIPTSDGIRISSNVLNIKGFQVFEISDGKIVEESYVIRAKVVNNPVASGDNRNPRHTAAKRIFHSLPELMIARS